jgi:hypothetical protein
VEKRLRAAVINGGDGAPAASDLNGGVLQHKGDEGKVRWGVQLMRDSLEAQLTETERRR